MALLGLMSTIHYNTYSPIKPIYPFAHFEFFVAIESKGWGFVKVGWGPQVPLGCILYIRTNIFLSPWGQATEQNSTVWHDSCIS